MKKSLLLLLLLGGTVRIALAQSNPLNMTLLARWDDDSLPIAPNYNVQYSGCWGLAVNGHEIAVLGAARHVLFFDVTEPTQPELIGKFAGTSSTAWREMKSYKNRIYAVSDNTQEGLMIFDLSEAPDTIRRSYWSSEFFSRAHTITLDTTSGRIYLNGSNVASQGLLVLDVSQNPDQPTLLANANLSMFGGYIHDSYVRRDTIYASSGYEGYYVFDFTNASSPQLITSVETGGYNHNSWLNTAGTYAYYTEEIPAGQPVRIVDLQNLANQEIEIAGNFLDQLTPNGGPDKAIPHNVYIKDNLLFNSQYEDGLLVYDISEPTQPVLLAHYDTHPQNLLYNKYAGNWGNYPWLPSGNIIAGDMQNGLFVLQLDLSVATHSPTALEATVFPNPARQTLSVQVPEHSTIASYQLRSPEGRLAASGVGTGKSSVQISVVNLPAGLYFLEIRSEEGAVAVRKVVVE